MTSVRLISPVRIRALAPLFGYLFLAQAGLQSLPAVASLLFGDYGQTKIYVGLILVLASVGALLASRSSTPKAPVQ